MGTEGKWKSVSKYERTICEGHRTGKKTERNEENGKRIAYRVEGSKWSDKPYVQIPTKVKKIE
ncbi:hypothetical protein CAEBREN_26101 [Caenorhabditis brenneri]|uniref:Uncharacterized protein n=1 Tax=Caenorhabditis brenneri TaxID=135651 RepID=G0MRE3_CAEBE|nr:hypothetical protein CAEBREN_26101 [Caenorhabditis brenneri]